MWSKETTPEMTQLGLLSSYSTCRPVVAETTTLTLASMYGTGKTAEAVRGALLSRYGTHSLTRVALDSRYRTVSTRRVRLTLTREYRTDHATRLGLVSVYATKWRGREVGDVRTVFQINGINLNNGTSTFLQPGANLGSDDQQYDLIQHYDGSLRQHNVHGMPVQMSIPVKFVFTTSSALSAFVDGVRESIKGGGYMVWQDGGDSAGDAQYFTLLQDTSPDAPRDNAYRNATEAIYTLTMMRFPRS